jgi:hypothetical protein
MGGKDSLIRSKSLSKSGDKSRARNSPALFLGLVPINQIERN